MGISGRIETVILSTLATGESRLLALTVLVRKSVGGSIPIKVDLNRLVVAALRKLVASKCISDSDGIYTIIKAQ
jgi:hypothetical protein